jgi:hypothetical protein
VLLLAVFNTPQQDEVVILRFEFLVARGLLRRFLSLPGLPAVVALVVLILGVASPALAYRYGKPDKLRSECRSGKVDSCFEAGLQYKTGWDLCDKREECVDYARAHPLFERACELGKRSGCLEVASALLEGRGCPQDRPRAIALLKEQCGDEHWRSCELLADAMKAGKGVPVDETGAWNIYEKACREDLLSSCKKSGLDRYFDDTSVVLGVGKNFDGDLVLKFEAYGTKHPNRIFSWYAEFEGYRLHLFYPTGMSVRILGFRVRWDSSLASTGFYWANGPYIAWGSEGLSNGDTPEEEQEGRIEVGGDSNMKLFLRLWYLPVLTASLRANVGTANFLEFRASIETGVWGDLFDRYFGLSLDYVRRFGSPWSSDQFDDQSLIGSIRVSYDVLRNLK